MPKCFKYHNKLYGTYQPATMTARKKSCGISFLLMVALKLNYCLVCVCVCVCVLLDTGPWSVYKL